MTRIGLLFALGVTLGLLAAWLWESDHSDRDGRGSAGSLPHINRTRNAASGAQRAYSSSERVPRPPKRPLVLDREAAALLPVVPGLIRWRDGRKRQAYLYRVMQPNDKRDLSKQRRWAHCLQCFGNQEDAHELDARFERLRAALAQATNPVARQNLIFLAAMTLEPNSARRLLDPIVAGDNAEDREDAVGALAFSGDAGMFATFRALPIRDAKVHRLVDSLPELELIAAAGTTAARRVLRSYRLIEALDRDPYFDIMSLVAPHDWMPPPNPSVETHERFLKTWLERYAGHPGSDDMGFRLGVLAVRRDDMLGAAVWFSRASTWPDQRVNDWGSPGHALRTCAEFFLDLGQLDHLLNTDGLQTPNRQWLQYVLVRRTAAEQGFEDGLRLAAAIATTEPETVLAQAWRERWAAPAPRGLMSGVTPLAPNDPLLAVANIATGPAMRVITGARVHRVTASRELTQTDREFWKRLAALEDQSRLYPSSESKAIDEARTAAQFRIWETLAELERRASRVRGDAAHDLIYKQGAIFYHEAANALLPTYQRGRRRQDSMMFSRVVTKARAQLVRHRFRDTSFGPLRAIALWRHLEQRATGYPGLDKALYSQGLAWRKMLDHEDAPVYHLPSHKEVVTGLVDAFDRCAQRFPQSPLARPASDASRYWRQRAPELFVR